MKRPQRYVTPTAAMIWMLISLSGCFLMHRGVIIGTIKNNSQRNIKVVIHNRDGVSFETMHNEARITDVKSGEAVDLVIPGVPEFEDNHTWSFYFFDGDALSIYSDSIAKQRAVRSSAEAYRDTFIGKETRRQSDVKMHKVNLVINDSNTAK